MVKLQIPFVSALLVFAACFAYGQNEAPETIVWFHPNQEVRVRDLPSPAASDSSTVLAAALETILHNKAVCCGKNSALEDIALADPQSLKELSAKLPGQYRLSDSRPISMSAAYVPQTSMNTNSVIVGSLLDQHALLIEWKSHLYVLYGAIFNDTLYSSGRRQYAILKLLLLDPRFSDQRRETEFNRETDDWGKVQGVLTLTVTQQ